MSVKSAENCATEGRKSPFAKHKTDRKMFQFLLFSGDIGFCPCVNSQNELQCRFSWLFSFKGFQTMGMKQSMVWEETICALLILTRHPEKQAPKTCMYACCSMVSTNKKHCRSIMRVRRHSWRNPRDAGVALSHFIIYLIISCNGTLMRTKVNKLKCLVHEISEWFLGLCAWNGTALHPRQLGCYSVGTFWGLSKACWDYDWDTIECVIAGNTLKGVISGTGKIPKVPSQVDLRRDDTSWGTWLSSLRLISCWKRPRMNWYERRSKWMLMSCDKSHTGNSPLTLRIGPFLLLSWLLHRFQSAWSGFQHFFFTKDPFMIVVRVRNVW